MLPVQLPAAQVREHDRDVRRSHVDTEDDVGHVVELEDDRTASPPARTVTRLQHEIRHQQVRDDLGDRRA